MSDYQGTDPVIPVLNRLKEVRSSWKYHLLYDDFSATVDELIEDVAFDLEVVSEYETHYRTTHFVPESGQEDVVLHSSQNEETSVSPKRPTKFDFVETRRGYAREATARTVDCSFCESGTRGCPNCATETVVTCPDCHTHRGGDCQNCTGTGDVTCPECSGKKSCINCGGSGMVNCHGCHGTGTVTETTTVTKKCPSCLGHDDDCTKCYGSGTVDERVSETVKHARCNGRGEVNCSNCRGSGWCPTCSGGGTVTCSNCSGTGSCQTCSGEGVKTCPTCGAREVVQCPVCRGETKLFTYTVDKYEYCPKTDDSSVIPDDFTEYHQRLDSEDRSTLEIDELTEAEVDEKLGLLNARIQNSLETAVSTFAELVQQSEDRQYDREPLVSDIKQQDALIKDRTEKVGSDWKNQPSDSYDANYLLDLRDRSTTGSKLHTDLLYQTYSYRILPLSMVTVTVGGQRQQLFSAGTQENNQIDMPDFRYSRAKCSLAGSLFLGAGVGSLSLATGNTYGAGTVTVPSALAQNISAILGQTLPNMLPLVGVAGGAAALLSAVAYAYTVRQSYSRDEEDLVLVVGERDPTITTFLTVLAHTLSLEDAGVVRDELYTKLSANLFDDVSLGSSLTISANLESSGLVRFVGMNWSDVSGAHADEVDELASHATGVIGLVSEGSDESTVRSVESYADDNDLSTAFVLSDEIDLDGDVTDAPVDELPLEELRVNYLEGNEETETDIMKSIEEVR